jgi:hypothetical protein
VSLGGKAFERSLPYPWVEYPSHYGTFFRFSSNPDGPFRYCSCNFKALANFSALRRLRFSSTSPFDDIAAHGLHLSLDAAAEMAKDSTWTPVRDDMLERACHRCNVAPPALRYCHEMYGGTWKQQFGWYTNLAFVEGGLEPIAQHNYLAGRIPEAIAKEHSEYVAFHSRMMKVAARQLPEEFAELQALHKTLGMLKTRITRHFESEARVAFGFKRVGDGWVSETLLFHLVQGHLPQEQVLRHHRPDWLNGLELDIYIPSLNVGIEYQGQQHSRPVKHWGGERAFSAQRDRDVEKKRLCADRGCRLIEFWHGEPLSAEAVMAKLLEAGVAVSSFRTL